MRLAAAWTDPSGAVHNAGDVVDIDPVTLAELEEQGVVDDGESTTVKAESIVKPTWNGPGDKPTWNGPGSEPTSTTGTSQPTSTTGTGTDTGDATEAWNGPGSEDTGEGA
ncbi:MAG: hypothetical protein J2P15_00335 [Micromonosporaceae bacterium]|nr:hypothetical protein [Micromonosporaceae bacterium]